MKEFENKVRILLILLAVTENKPPSERMKIIDGPRQYLEGYLGIDREGLSQTEDAIKLLRAAGIKIGELT
jgi:hypothetical protein